MNGRRNKALNESTGLRGVPAMTGAETVAIGTAAGALMLGVLQADAAPKEAVRPTRDALMHSLKDGQVHASDQGAPNAQYPGHLTVRGTEASGQAASVHPPTVAGQAAAPPAKTQAANDSGQGRDIQTSDHAGPSDAHDGGQDSSSAEASSADAGGAHALTGTVSPIIDAIDAQSIATRIADQVTTAIGQISDGLHQGLAPEAIGQSIAGEISTAVAGIAKDIEASLTGLHDLAGDAGSLASGVLQLDALGAGIDAEVSNVFDHVPNAAGILSDTTGTLLPGLEGASAGLHDSATSALDSASAVAQVASLLQGTGPAEAIPSLSTPMQDIPATILGAETADGGSVGLLSEIFYDDGKSDSASAAQSATSEITHAPALPEAAQVHAAEPGDGSPLSDVLSEAVFVMDDTGAAHGMDFAGVSYLDAHDQQYTGMLSTPNALHVL